MKISRNNSLSGILHSTNNYLLLAISSFLVIVGLAGVALLYQSHRTVCELFNTKMESASPNIARELVLGEKAIAAGLFEKVSLSLRRVNSEVNLILDTDNKDDISNGCSPGITNSKINYLISFSGEKVGHIKGEIKSFKFNIILLFIFSISSILFLLLKVFKNKLIYNINTQLVRPIELLCSEELVVQDSFPSELKDIAGRLSDLKSSIALSEKAKLELSHAEKLSNISRQVAHDIRSPLEVLKSLNEEISSLPLESKRMIQLSISRIEEIAFNLLKNHRVDLHLEESSSTGLLDLLKSIIIEKKIEYRNRNVSFDENFDPGSYGLFSNINQNSLKNVISNLINNAIDSLEGSSGIIKLKLYSRADKAFIEVIDNGIGISFDLYKNIFNKGFTTKRTGNGLGLFNAKQDIEAMGGTLLFESVPDKGTTFTIALPKSDIPPSFVASIKAYNYERIIVLDDDPAFHEVWSKRLEGLESKVEHIHSVEEMLSKYQSLNPKILLLSDFELMDKNLDGIDTILKLNHALHSVLVTARSEEQAIQDRCIKAGIKLLPKSLVNYVKVFKDVSDSSQTSTNGLAEKGSGCSNTLERHNPKPLVVLIDDDRLIHINWASHCKKASLQFKSFRSIEEFIAASESLDKNSRIYIDSNLGQGIKGEIESEKLFYLGFVNLYLATGYNKSSIQKPSWIKEICSKSPENIR